MKRVVVPEFLPQTELSRLRARFDVVYDPDLYRDRPALLRQLSGAAAIVVRNRTQVDAGLLSVAADLEMIGRLGVGLDNIDTRACAEAGVTVIPAVGANAVSVAEYVIGAMLVLLRPVFGMTADMVAGVWPRQGHAFGRELSGQTLGLVGYGSIARQVALRAAALDMRVMACDPHVPHEDPAWTVVERQDLDELLAAADVVTIHVALTDQTRHLIDGRALRLMKPTAVVINTSRGRVVDEAALVGALQRGELAGAALDVFEVEPLGPDQARRFAGIDNLILTPHLAGNTDESVERVARMIVDEVLARVGDR